MARALSLDEIRKRCTKVVADWKDEPGDERQQAQSFIRDLLWAFGITRSKAALYEKRARRTSTGQQGYIDALIPGLLVIEMKSAGKDLDRAEAQALDYLDDLADIEMPSRVLTSDFRTLRLLDLKKDNGADTIVFPLEELPQHAEDLAFLAGFQTREFGSKEQEQISVRAAQIMGKLYEQLEGTGYSDHEASIFLVRILFALYADDAGMWERDLFYEFLENRTREDGTDLGAQLTMLFQVMNQPEHARQTNLDSLVSRFPYVNGGIFGEPTSIPMFTSDMRELLLDACAFNWAEISPAIFGSLFQSVKSAAARRELGEHYTTETNILKTIEPLFLDELREEFQTYFYDLKRLEKLREKIGKIKVLDPACGCGNFLVVAYRDLRQLDLEILTQIEKLRDEIRLSGKSATGDALLFFDESDVAVKLENFAGIEIEEWPARIAQTALYLVEHQANQKIAMTLGRPPNTLPLDKVECIHVGNALRTEWGKIFPPSEHVIILGNPPFSGHKDKTVAQREDLAFVWGDQLDGYFDYVTGWYKKAADFFQQVPYEARFAFVSTNSITQGLPVASLFQPLISAGWRIKFAHQTFAWTSEATDAAAVHCVIIGMDKGGKTPPVLYTYSHVKATPVAIPAKNINGYLIDAPNIFVTKRSRILSPNLPTVNYGTMPVDNGNLLVEDEEVHEIKADPVAVKYLRKFAGAKELLHNADRWCLWMEDLDPKDVKNSKILRDRIAACREWRSSQTPTGDAYKLRDVPHLFRPNKSRPTVPYLCIPEHVSETRAFFLAKRFDATVISGNANFTAEDPDGYLFGIISSSMFITWQKAIGGRLESRLRFSKTVVWNNLPLPQVSDKIRQDIIDAGQGILDARALHPERSLAEHYNPLAMAPELLKAHKALDQIVDRAFGAKTRLDTDEERIALLFKNYLKLTEADVFGKTKKRR